MSVIVAFNSASEGRRLCNVRKQFPITLGWAIPPWKAQGMTLTRAVVKLRGSVGDSGVLFVAISRARNPDGLMLDDDFPPYYDILKQSRHPLSNNGSAGRS